METTKMYAFLGHIITLYCPSKCPVFDSRSFEKIKFVDLIFLLEI